MKRLLPLTVLAILIAGCSTPALTGDQVASSTKRTFDPYTQRTQFVGPRANIPQGQPGRETYYRGEFLLRVTKQGDRFSTVQLYLDFTSFDWAFLSRATASTGEELEVVKIDQKVNTVATITVNEILGANFDLDWLRRHSSGFSVRFYGRRMNCDVYVSEAYIQGFLKALE